MNIHARYICMASSFVTNSVFFSLSALLNKSDSEWIEVCKRKVYFQKEGGPSSFEERIINLTAARNC